MRTTSYDFENEDAVFKVLVNHEEQYSLWPADLPVPGGWNETGQKGPKAECDEYIERVWTDMRPKSLREWMDGQGQEAGESAAAEDASGPSDTSETAPPGE
ncbi:MbtH family protein [Actinomadura nitritigenes]|uniref:MbtH family protein n=1 Tax=Actinomadura nitritigenes TaxID=134602 RepID=UPI003D8ADF03